MEQITSEVGPFLVGFSSRFSQFSYAADQNILVKLWKWFMTLYIVKTEDSATVYCKFINKSLYEILYEFVLE